MKLDRNITGTGRGKYALLKLRNLEHFKERDDGGDLAKPISDALETLERAGILDWGDTPATEFFVMRLKDKYASQALHEYALEAMDDGEDDYGQEVRELARRAGPNHPNCKVPD